MAGVLTKERYVFVLERGDAAWSWGSITYSTPAARRVSLTAVGVIQLGLRFLGGKPRRTSPRIFTPHVGQCVLPQLSISMCVAALDYMHGKSGNSARLVPITFVLSEIPSWFDCTFFPGGGEGVLCQKRSKCSTTGEKLLGVLRCCR